MSAIKGSQFTAYLPISSIVAVLSMPLVGRANANDAVTLQCGDARR